MSVSRLPPAPRGRYDIAEPRAVRVLWLVSLVAYVAMVVLLVVWWVWLRRVLLEGWREWAWDVLFWVAWLVIYPLAWWRAFSRQAKAVEWDEAGLVLHTVAGRGAAVPWEAVRELRVPFVFAGLHEAAGKVRPNARLFVVGQRRPYAIPLRWDEACTSFVGAVKARGRVVDV